MLALLCFVRVRVRASVGYVCVRVCCGLVVVVTFTLMEFLHVNTVQNSTEVLRQKNWHGKQHGTLESYLGEFSAYFLRIQLNDLSVQFA